MLFVGRFAGAALRLPVEQNSLCPFGASSFGPNLFCSGDFVALRSLGWVIAITVMGGKDTKIGEKDTKINLMRLCPFGASSFGPNLFCSGDFVALRSLGWVIAITVMGGKDTKIGEKDTKINLMRLCPFGASSFGPNLFCSGDFVAWRSLVWVNAVVVMGGGRTRRFWRRAVRTGARGRWRPKQVTVGGLLALDIRDFQLIVLYPCTNLRELCENRGFLLAPQTLSPCE